MLRQLVRFRIISYTFGDPNKLEENLLSPLGIIEALYADEWCLQMTARQAKEAVKDKDKKVFPTRCIWMFDTSRTTLDAIMEYFDSVEQNPMYTYYIDIDDK